MTDNHEFNYKICRRFIDPADAHYITYSCFRHQALLTEDRIRERLISALQDACSKHTFGLWAYVVMPDRKHANPFRKGLCDHPADWKLSSAAQYGETNNGALTLDRSGLLDGA
jgi:hypothetical protein